MEWAVTLTVSAPAERDSDAFAEQLDDVLTRMRRVGRRSGPVVSGGIGAPNFQVTVAVDAQDETSAVKQATAVLSRALWRASVVGVETEAR